MSILARLRIAWERRDTLAPLLRNQRATFSQYAEDIVFDRLLHPGNKGIYVDVGANDPIAGSNTYKLYCRGWSGLAIDPNPAFAAAYRRLRPRDIFLAEGVAKIPATLLYHEFAQDVFNTFHVPTIDKLREQGNSPIRSIEIPCRPLSDMIDDHLGDQHVDLLNVDCEGFDVDVLESLAMHQRRPTTIIVEDFPRFVGFRDGLKPQRLERFLREHGYAPLAQMGWSGLYVAEDWEVLFARSDAFCKDRMNAGYLPKQASSEEVGADTA